MLIGTSHPRSFLLRLISILSLFIVGSALTDLGDEAPEDYLVHGPDRITALPKEVSVCYQERVGVPGAQQR